MPRYTFDVHDDGAAAWGDTSHLFTDRDGIEQYARQLIDEALRRQLAMNAPRTVITVSVDHEDSGIVLMAYGRQGEDVRLVWTAR